MIESNRVGTRSTVEVLMSTYNGKRYINEQLASIYGQEGVDVRLRVRDDGSTDGTQSLLEAEQAVGRLTWYSGPNLGAARSFWDLLSTASGADFYAFSDQDDVWDRDKLHVAVEWLEGEGERPALYFCQTQLVDEQLRPLPSVRIAPLLTYGEALVSQLASGCTMVLNEAMRQVLRQYTPAYLKMHDMWIYGVAMAIGAAVYFDAEPHIGYRQHAGNVVGESDSIRVQWRKRWARIKKGERIRSHTAEELWKGYADQMPVKNKELTKLVLGYRRSWRAKLRLLVQGDLRCASRLIGLTSKTAVLFNMF